MKKKQKIFIFGASNCGMEFYKKIFKRYDVRGFLDNDVRKHGRTVLKKKIYSPSYVNELDFDKIVIASDYHVDIYKQLIDTLNVDPGKVSFYFDESILEEKLSLFLDFKNKIKYLVVNIACSKRAILSYLFFNMFIKRDKCIKRFPRVWLDECYNFVVAEVEGSSVGKLYPPSTYGKKIIKEANFPSVNLYRFFNGTISSGSRSIITGNKVIIERVETSVDENNIYNGGQVLFCGRTYSLVNFGSNQVLEKGIWISAVNDTNYYHWIIEAISQIEYLNKIPENYKDYPILVSVKAKEIPAIKMILDNIYHGNVIYLNTTLSYNVGELLVLSTPNALVANKNNSSWSVYDSYARENSILYLRNMGLKLATLDGNNSRKTPNKVFLARKGILRKYNQSEIFGFLESYGFVAIYMEDLSFIEQVKVINGADYIVGPTGAAWTNIIFSNCKAKALCWMAEELGDISCFSNLAAIIGVDMEYIFYRAGTKDSREIYFREYVIKLDSVKEWVSRLSL